MHKITLVGKWASSVTQLVKNLPASAGDMRHTSLMLRSPDWDDPVEKEMATHSSIPAKTIPWAEETGRLQSMGLQRVGKEQACMHRRKTVVFPSTERTGRLGK